MSKERSTSLRENSNEPKKHKYSFKDIQIRMIRTDYSLENFIKVNPSISEQEKTHEIKRKTRRNRNSFNLHKPKSQEGRTRESATFSKRNHDKENAFKLPLSSRNQHIVGFHTESGLFH
jgi:hypothetical protein